MRLPTREKLLETIDGIVRYSKSHPVCQFIIDFIDENETLRPGTLEIYTLDDLMATMMDKSFLYQVVKVNAGDLWAHGRICVIITLTPAREYQTNIDGEFMESLSELTIIPIGEEGQ